jgi:hypothetical protein
MRRRSWIALDLPSSSRAPGEFGRGFEEIVGLGYEGSRPEPIFQISRSDDDSKSRKVSPDPGRKLGARQDPRHPVIGENEIYRAPRREILPSLVPGGGFDYANSAIPKRFSHGESN